MQKNINRIVFGILIILNCALIFWFSNQIADNSSAQSSRIVDFISNILPAIRDMGEQDKTILKQEILTPIVRKMAHFSIYTMLGMFTMNYTNTYRKDKLYPEAIKALIFCICYSISDEIHQMFIPGRSGEIRDVLIDTSGALLGITFTIVIVKIILKIKQKNRKENVSKN